jgi:hypothetical protein
VSLPKWQVSGTKQGKPKVVCVRAPDWQGAVRAASGMLLVVQSAVLVEDRQEALREKAVLKGAA